MKLPRPAVSAVFGYIAHAAFGVGKSALFGVAGFVVLAAGGLVGLAIISDRRQTQRSVKVIEEYFAERR